MIITNRIDDLNIILNCVLDPFKFNVQLNSIKNEPLNKDFSRYYKYINENMHKSNKLTQLRILNQFCYSMNFFHVLLQHDLFPYDDFSNIYKILIADRMKHMYWTYYHLIFSIPVNLSINTLKLYYLCLSLKKKINKYKLCGKLAWDEIRQCSIEELNTILYSCNQYKLIINSPSNKFDTDNSNILLIIKYYIYIDNILYLQQLTNYIINNFDYIIYHIKEYETLIYLNNRLYSNKISNIEFETLLYNYIMKKIGTKNDIDDIIKDIDNIFSISSSNTWLNKKLHDYRQSHVLLNKI